MSIPPDGFEREPAIPVPLQVLEFVDEHPITKELIAVYAIDLWTAGDFKHTIEFSENPDATQAFINKYLPRIERLAENLVEILAAQA